MTRRAWYRLSTTSPLALLVLMLVGPPEALDAQGKWVGWDFYWENDTGSLDFFGDATDLAYTNGVRFTLARHPDENLFEGIGEWMLEKSYADDPNAEISSALVIGQNMFTPNIVTTFDIDPEDRPYAGFLYGGVRITVTEGASTGGKVQGQHALELDLGVLGPPSFAREAQKGIHLLQASRDPKGWGSQLATELAPQAVYLGRWRVGRSQWDVVPHIGGALGTVQTFANAGVTARIGWNLTGFPSIGVPWTAEPTETVEETDWDVALLAGVDAKGYARNSYLEGNLLGGARGVDLQRGVVEWRAGVMVRVHSWRVNYSHVERSAEFLTPDGSDGGTHGFASLSIGRDLNRITPGSETAWRKDWMVELGMGGGASRELESEGVDRTQGGMAARLGVAKGLNDRFGLGLEMAGALRQGELPDVNGIHTDTFLQNRAVTLRYNPFGRESERGVFHLRGGLGSAKATVQANRGPEHWDIRSDTGLGLLLGAGYAYPLGEQGSATLIGTWSHLGVDSDDGPAATMFISTFGFQWHP